jgi:hypothetical protein
MMFVLLMAGIGLLLAGLLTVGLGIQMDLSFGNTLILTGAIAACTGMIMLSLWAVARELKKIALRLGSGIPLESRAGTETAPDRRKQAADNGGFPSGRDRRGREDLDNLELEVEAPSSAPWQAEPAGRDRGRNDGAISPEPAEAATAVKKPRRNLLFSSSSRKERERAQGRMPDPSAADLGPAPPPLESDEIPSAPFEDSWSKPERSRGADVPPQRRGGRAPSNFTEANAGAAGADRYPPPARREDRPGVTILKSGVVDGMAYSLYSDGSIEAQMPEGMMRFASIDDLRAHLDQRP